MWVKLHGAMYSDPRTCDMALQLYPDICPDNAEKLVVAMLGLMGLWAQEYAQNGTANDTPGTHRSLAQRVRWHGAPAELVDVLVDAGFMQKEDNMITIIDWEHWGWDAMLEARERQRKSREARAATKNSCVLD